MPNQTAKSEAAGAVISEPQRKVQWAMFWWNVALLAAVGAIVYVVCRLTKADLCLPLLVGYASAAVVCVILRVVYLLPVFYAPAPSDAGGISHLHLKNGSGGKWLKRLRGRRKTEAGPIVDLPPHTLIPEVTVYPDIVDYHNVWFSEPVHGLTLRIPLCEPNGVAVGHLEATYPDDADPGSQPTDMNAPHGLYFLGAIVEEQGGGNYSLTCEAVAKTEGGDPDPNTLWKWSYQGPLV